MNDVEIERCNPPEWKRYRDLRLRALAEAPEAFWHTFAEESTYGENQWRERLGGAGRATFLAVRGGGDVGLVTIGPPTWDAEADPENHDLGGFWVAPQARRSEISRQLLDAALDHARAEGAAGVTLWLIGDNEPAQRLYERAGFAFTGREHKLAAPRTETEREMLLRFA